MDAIGDIRTGQTINVNGTNTESEGGSVRIESNTGSVLIEGQIRAEGGTAVYYYGMDSYGGEIVLTAAVDVTVLGALSGSGRDGGGETTLTAGRDIIVEAQHQRQCGNR